MSDGLKIVVQVNEALRLQPGDTILARLGEEFRDHGDEIAEFMRAEFPEQHVLVLVGDITIGVLPYDELVARVAALERVVWIATSAEEAS